VVDQVDKRKRVCEETTKGLHEAEGALQTQKEANLKLEESQKELDKKESVLREKFKILEI
jgi:hypothetical protein